MATANGDIVIVAILLYMERVVQKAINANPGLKFNRLFILVCYILFCFVYFGMFCLTKHFIVCMISEKKFSNIFVYIFIILSTKFPLTLD